MSWLSLFFLALGGWRLNPSWIHIPDGLIRSLCRHIDPLIWISLLRNWIGGAWDPILIFSRFEPETESFCPFSFFFSFLLLLWTTPEKSFDIDKHREQKNRVPRVRSKKCERIQEQRKKKFQNLKKNRELFEDRTKKTNYEDIIILIVKKKIEKKF